MLLKVSPCTTVYVNMVGVGRRMIAVGPERRVGVWVEVAVWNGAGDGRVGIGVAAVF
jgi:hypothetical protein